MTSAATGSAHHQPSRPLSPTPTSAATDSHQHAVVWNASASMASLPSSRASFRFARASQSITAIESARSATPTALNVGLSPVHRVCAASNVMYAASRKSEQRDEPSRAVLHGLEPLAAHPMVALCAQAPDHHERRRALHEAVDAEPEDGNAASDDGSRHRDDPLDDVPPDGEVLEAQRAVHRLRPEVGF